MVRDITGKRIRKNLSGFEQTYMELFYIHNKQVYQIVRVKKQRKISGVIVEVTYRKAFTLFGNTKKVKSYTLTLEGFENRKYFKSSNKATKYLIKENNGL